MSPDAISTCGAGNGGIASVAKWDVTAQRIQEVSIYVVDAEGMRKLWLSGAAKGEASTGKWVYPGSRFELVDHASGRPISQVTMQALPCP